MNRFNVLIALGRVEVFFPTKIGKAILSKIYTSK